MSHSISTNETPSIETSVPTDLTITSHGQSELSSTILDGREKGRYSLVEKLKLQVRERDAKIQALNAQKEEELNRLEFKKDSECSKKLAKIHLLEAELQSTQEELKLFREKAAKELVGLLEKCTQFQQTQDRINVTHDEVKENLEHLCITEEEYSSLKRMPTTEMGLKEFTALKLHENIVPLKLKVQELSAAKSSISSALRSGEKQIESQNEELALLQQNISKMTERILHYEKSCNELRDSSKNDDFRVVNFTRIKQERDKLEEDNYQLRKANSLFESDISTLRKEKDAREQRLTDAHHKCTRIEQEYMRYKSDASEDTKQLGRIKEQLRSAQTSLTLEREKLDDIHKKYLTSRSDNISLGDSVRELQDRVKILNEKSDKSTKNEMNVEDKYYKLVKNYEDVFDELEKLKQKYLKEVDKLTFNLEQGKQSHEILTRNYEVSRSDIVIVKEKLEKAELNLDYERTKYDNDVSLLKSELRDFKSLEDEYRATITAIASQPEGVQIPLSGKLSHEAVSLTRRVLQLERHNMEACETIRKLTSALDQLKIQIKAYKSAIAMAGKPATELMESIAVKEDTILSLEKALNATRECKKQDEIQFNNLKDKYYQVVNQFKEALEDRYEIIGLKEDVLRISKAFNQQQGLPAAIKITKDKR